jgi:PKD repeat protein
MMNRGGMMVQRFNNRGLWNSVERKAVAPGFIFLMTCLICFFSACSSDLLDPIIKDVLAAAAADLVGADFTAIPTSGDAYGAIELVVDFTDASTGPVTGRSWDFGDGIGTSTETNPTYTYADPGVYTVTLTVTGPGSAGDTIVKTDYITAYNWHGVRQIADSTTTADHVGTVSVNGSNVYVSYRIDYMASTTRVYVAYSTDNCESFSGTDFNNQVYISASSVDLKTPNVVASTNGSYVYLSAFADSWTSGEDDEILFWRSTNNCSNWSTPVSLASDTWDGYDFYKPYMMISRPGSDDYIYVTTYIDRDPQINYRRSINSGVNWQATAFSGTDGHNSTSISAALDSSGNVRNAYYYNVGGNDPIIFSGATVVYNINGTGDPSNVDTAIAAEGSGNFYVAFNLEGTGIDSGLSVCRSTDDGSTWGARLGIDSDGTTDCAIAVEGSKVYISYSDGESLLLAKSTNSGISFNIYPVDTDLDATTTMGHGSSIAVDGDSVYIRVYDAGSIP